MTINKNQIVNFTNPFTEVLIGDTVANDGGHLQFSATDVAVASGAVFGQIDWYSNDASANCSGNIARIQVIAEADLVGGAYTSMLFHTNTGNAGTLTERLRITYDGNVKIPTDSGKLYFGADDDVFTEFDGSVWRFDSGAFEVRFPDITSATGIGIGKSFSSHGGYGNLLDIEGGIAMQRSNDAGNTYFLSAFNTGGGLLGYFMIDSGDNVRIVNAQQDEDIEFRFNDGGASRLFYIDASASHYRIPYDNAGITFGEANDATICWDGDDLALSPVSVSAGGVRVVGGAGDSIYFSHDGTDAYTKWDDGDFYLITDEGTDTNTKVRVQGKGTGEGYVYSDYLNLTEQSDPTNEANTGFVYTKDVGGETELFYEDASGNVLQISSSGELMAGNKYIYIAAAAQAEGNLDLSDGTNWNTDKSIIKGIHVDTVSVDWDLTLYPDDDFDELGTFPSLKLAENANSDQLILIDLPYYDTDDSQEIHLKYTDNAGADTADIYIWGVTTNG